jgi:uncharacterized protein YbjT (DUF2867 family)
MKITIAANSISGTGRNLLVERLLDAGAEVTLVTASPTDHDDLTRLEGASGDHGHSRLNLVEGLPDDAEALRSAARGSDVLIWSLPAPRRSKVANGFDALWSSALAALTETVVVEDVRHVVHLSHFGVWQQTGSRLVDAIAKSEQTIDQVAIHATHLRAGFVLDNLLLQLPVIRSTQNVYLPLFADTRFPVITVDALAERSAVAALATPHGRRVLHAAQGVGTFSEIVRALSDGTGIEIEMQRLLASAAQAFFESLGCTSEWAQSQVEALVQTDRENVVAEPGSAEALPSARGTARHWAEHRLRPLLSLSRLAG